MVCEIEEFVGHKGSTFIKWTSLHQHFEYFGSITELYHSF